MSGQQDVVAERAREYFDSGSAIRRMFTEGLRLSAKYGSENVADLSLGNPTFDPPDEFVDAIWRIAHEGGPHSYMPNAGYPEVRARVAANLEESGFFTGIAAEHILMTTGAAGALNVVLATILDPGDEVIVLKPYFVEYRFYVEAHGGVVKFVNTLPTFRLDVDAIRRAITSRTRAIIVNSPNNPTGRVYTRDELDQLVTVLRERRAELKTRIMLLSDEPYREVVYGDAEFVSPASMYSDSFMCYSWSKAYNISGERIGYIAVNPKMETSNWSELLGSLSVSNRILGFVNAPAFMQRVIAEALGAAVELDHYREKRDMLCEALDEAGYEYAIPEGAFYIFVRTQGDEAELVELARSNNLLVVPGTDFGCEGHFRLSYAVSEDTVRLACEKLKQIAPHRMHEIVAP